MGTISKLILVFIFAFGPLANAFFTNTCMFGLLVGGGASLPRPLPYLKQDMNGKCGPATAAIAAAYFGNLNSSGSRTIYDLADFMTMHGHRINYQLRGCYPPAVLSVADLADTNASSSLVASLTSLGLRATQANLNLTMIAMAVAQNQVVMLHWTMGNSALEGHWSAVQAITPQYIHLRDPWPYSPSDHFIALEEFYNRALISPGLFSGIIVAK